MNFESVVVGLSVKFIFVLFDVGHSIISVLPEISCKGLTKDDLPQLIEKTQNLMQAHYEEISKESRRINHHLTVY